MAWKNREKFFHGVEKRGLRRGEVFKEDIPGIAEHGEADAGGARAEEFGKVALGQGDEAGGGIEAGFDAEGGAAAEAGIDFDEEGAGGG